jgi:oligopeptide/dipeptide ABC transporter ATP-binding protein
VTVPPPLLETKALRKYFALGRTAREYLKGQGTRAIHAVDGVSLEVARGECLGLIGESGSGKTTFGWLIARILEPTSGRIVFDGEVLFDSELPAQQLQGPALRRWRRQVQVVFQDPVGSLDPRLRVWQIVSEPIRAQEKVSRRDAEERVAQLLPTVGLPPETLDMYPHEFSGGGRQRISLARALSVDPRLIVLDEPTSALDVAVQAQILNRLVQLQRERNLSYLLITHNVAAVRYVADRIAVMYIGQLVEVGPVREVLTRPVHPYTKALLAAVPVADTRRRHARYRVGGEIPTLIDPAPGCRFAPRCPFVVARCRAEDPPLREVAGFSGRTVACHRAEEIADVPPEAFLDPGVAPRVPTPGTVPVPGS